jgi:Glycosyl hydrolase family 20, domain 2
MRLSAFAVVLASMALGATGPAVAAPGSERGTAATPTGQSQNPAPAVVPALREWTGGTGVVYLSPASRIVVDSGSLADEADQLRDDIAAITGFGGDRVAVVRLVAGAGRLVRVGPVRRAGELARQCVLGYAGRRTDRVGTGIEVGDLALPRTS